MTPRPPKPSRRDRLRVAWTLAGMTRTVEAVVFQTDAGVELVVQWNDDEIFLSQWFPTDAAPLAARADALRQELEAKGWTLVA